MILTPETSDGPWPVGARDHQGRLGSRSSSRGGGVELERLDLWAARRRWHVRLREQRRLREVLPRLHAGGYKAAQSGVVLGFTPDFPGELIEHIQVLLCFTSEERIPRG